MNSNSTLNTAATNTTKSLLLIKCPTMSSQEDFSFTNIEYNPKLIFNRCPHPTSQTLPQHYIIIPTHFIYYISKKSEPA